MNKKKVVQKLFFSKTLDFLEHYLSCQVRKSKNTVETYRDSLTVFRRYISEILHLSIRSFCFEDCTHDLLLSYIQHLRESGNAQPVTTVLLPSELTYGMWLTVIYPFNQSH